MNLLQSILLGILQGLTEFLPVSSSGHLVLARKLFGIDGDMLLFDIIVHAGTLAAVIAVFFKEIFDMIRHPVENKSLRLLIVASIPTVIIFFCFESFFRDSFSGRYLGFGFLVTAVLLLVTDITLRKNQKKEMLTGEIGYKRALIMGAAQGIAVLPGISRSGSTICAALISGAEREKAAKFSFLMSIPIILGSALLEGASAVKDGLTVSVDLGQLFAGFVCAALSGFLAIKFMLKIVAKCRLWIFSVYLFALSVFILINDFLLTAPLF